MKSKIPLLIINNAQKLIKKLIPSIINIADETGIVNIGQENMVMPNSCLSPDKLRSIMDLRNNLINTLNSTSNLIKTLSKPINTLSNVVNTTSVILDTTNKARIAANVALSFVPVTPGAAPAGINTLKDITETLYPKIQLTKNSINSISEALTYANDIIYKLNNLIKIIDLYMLRCGVNSNDLISTNNYINEINNQYEQKNINVERIYKGFTLDIVEENFSPTVNRRKAVALNPQGIVLLQTPLSFTSTPDVLIEQIKLIIDNNNLEVL